MSTCSQTCKGSGTWNWNMLGSFFWGLLWNWDKTSPSSLLAKVCCKWKRSRWKISATTSEFNLPCAGFRTSQSTQKSHPDEVANMVLLLTLSVSDCRYTCHYRCEPFIQLDCSTEERLIDLTDSTEDTIESDTNVVRTDIMEDYFRSWICLFVIL